MTHCTETLDEGARAESGSLSRLLGDMIRQFLNWRRRRRDRAALMRQPDYLLRDIGIERREIDGKLRGHGGY